MQSELFEVTQKDLSTNLELNTQETRRHGFRTQNDSAQDRFVQGTCLGESARSTITARASAFLGASMDEIADDPTGDIPRSSFQRLSSASESSTSSPVDRIIEYETAFIQATRRKNEGSTFILVSSGNRGTLSKISVTDFPNEVLTHVLSHLPPKSLSDIALVSRRFHGLVTTPHAWRMAFARYFPGAQALTKFDLSGYIAGEPSATLIVEKRIFTRLTAHASWRNEYVLRTGLLLSLARGKPADLAGDSVDGRPKPNPSHRLTAQVTYNSNLVTTVTHLHASFGSTSRKHPAVIHGTDEGGSACLSDPKKGKVDHWGFVDPRLFSQFVEQFPGEAQYGLGSGEMIGIPNVMSVSQPYGMVYAECFPGGSLYYRSTEEHRGHTLASVPDVSSLELGIPKVYGLGTVCSVWISKTSNIPEISSGLVGILAGSSQGIVSAYSLGISSLFESRAERGEVTARWVLSPGVPIIAINVDENFSVKRQRSQRIWAVVLNALGEVYYLSQLPVRPSDGRRKLSALSSERVAWRVGRSVGWKLIEATKRTAKPDPFRESTIDGSYSPRTSWDGMGLSKQQIIAETREIEAFMQRKPKHFRQCCEGWDMRRKLEVDFGASDENGEGEGIIVIKCGLEEGHMTSIKRYTRSKGVDCGSEPVPTSGSVPYSDVKPRPADCPISPYTMGLDEKQPVWPLKDPNLSRRSSAASQDIGISGIDEWRTAVFEIGASKSTQITTVAMDMSTFALLTMQEDPFLTLDSSSEVSTPSFSPQDHIRLPNSPLDIPGQRGRFLAAGTKTGTVIVWNVRDPVSSCKMVDSIIRPVRVIQTDSPEISCLALSALYLVHGGNDGLVQAWDPLASNTEPIRTLNSRFSSRARRRLLQAQSLPGGEGINLFAAGAVFLDPDPTTLRGVVSLGAHLRYWSYNSLATNLYKSNKRRFRRSGRMGNHGPDRYTGTARGTLHDYIANEKLDLEQDKKDKRKEGERLAGRFGLDLLGPGASEEEVLAYATLLSEESAVSDEEKRKISRNNSVHGLNGPLKDGDEAALHFSALYEDEDADLAEAIRLSLQESNLMLKSEFEEDEHVGPAAFTVRYVKARNSSSP